MLPRPTPIPTLTAMTVIGDPKTSGKSSPFQIRCESSNGSCDYVVKLWAHPELWLGKHALAREVYGSMLAKTLGLNTPDIAFIDIEPDFYLSQPNSKSELLRISTGLNFGSSFIPQAKIFSSPVPPTKHALAVKIFCFDMFIGNMDRRVGKPNLFDLPDGYMVYDHEQAFPFSRPQLMLGGYPPGWEYIKEAWSRDHILFSSIHERDCGHEIEEFIQIAGYISDEIIDTIEEQIPEDWRTDNDLQNIKLYLANTRENMQLFKRSLQEILA